MSPSLNPSKFDLLVQVFEEEFQKEQDVLTDSSFCLFLKEVWANPIDQAVNFSIKDHKITNVQESPIKTTIKKTCQACKGEFLALEKRFINRNLIRVCMQCAEKITESRKKHKAISNAKKICFKCKKTSTPQWRMIKIEETIETFCNACGIKYKKRINQ